MIKRQPVRTKRTGSFLQKKSRTEIRAAFALLYFCLFHRDNVDNIALGICADGKRRIAADV